jgi:hypothetical protein
MKSNYNDLDHDSHSSDRSHYISYDDFNILEPSPDCDLSSPDDDEDELSDYSLMKNDFDLDNEY